MNMCGCFFTTQSFNSGKILVPGVTRFGAGFGRRSFVFREWDYDYYTGYGSYHYEEQTYMTYNLNYRLGVLKKYPFGGGLELGWMFEAPVALERSGAASLECDSRFGFKAFRLGKGVFHHNMAAGWLIGQWVDNSWYLEYAAGYEIKTTILYAGYRGILAGTDFISKDGDPFEYVDDGLGFGRFRPSSRSWNNRMILGLRWYTGEVLFIPDYFIPEISVIFPEYHIEKDFAVNFSLGMQWEFK
jgi:hypothetical protein